MDLEMLRPWELYDAIVELPDGVSELYGLYCRSVEEVLVLLGHRGRPLGTIRLAGLRPLPTPALLPAAYAVMPLAVDVRRGTPVLVARLDELGPLAA